MTFKMTGKFHVVVKMAFFIHFRFICFNFRQNTFIKFVVIMLEHAQI